MAEIFGLELNGELPEGWQPISAAVVVRCVDMSDGVPTLRAFATDGLSSWEAYGMLGVMAGAFKADCVQEMNGDG